MSLQLAAQHLSDQGRGPDNTLVHMSRDEVKSLNDLAMAHGGQLTINPETGLPEAGFLSMILPLVAGAALGPAGMGLTAMQAGLLVGAGSYALNPKGGLMGGLSAGLGGYGGAGLGAGLSGIATSEAGASVQNLANEGAQQEVARQTAQQQAQQQLAMNSGYANIDPGVVNPALSGDQLATIKSNIVNEQLLANPPPTGMDAMYKGAESLVSNPTADKFKALGGGSYSGLARMGLAAAAPAAGEQAKFTPPPTSATAGKQVVPHYKFSPGAQTPTPTASPTGVENVYFKPQYTALSDEEAKQMYPGYGAYVPPTAANGGLMGYAGGGPVEQMSNDNAIGANTGFPQAYLHNNAYATPYQTPTSQNVLTGTSDVRVDPYTGEQRMAGGGQVPSYGFGGFIGDAVNDIGSHLGSMFKGGSGDFGNVGPMLDNAQAPAGTRYDPETKQYVPINSEQMATGGISDAGYNLGSYSDGGRLLRGPGDGVSDSIPAVIGKKQPARLADGEFVVPARIVSELGNGSTEAGARKLYAMMDRIQAARGKTVGKGRVAKNSRSEKYLPA
jgi:hypothetical protein